jgi:succinyl-CoA synthetase beta subunit
VVSSGPPLSEYAGKQILAERGVRVPAGAVAAADGVADVARSIGFPVVAKVASGLVHKSDADGVRLGLDDQQQLADAVAAMCDRADAFLIEQQVDGAVAELVVGVQRDPQYGLALTVGTGGVLVELLRDTATLLIPTSRSQIRSALRTLRGWPLLTGFRGRKPADVDAVLDTVQAVARYAYDCRDCLVELEINPLLVLPEGQGAVAADVVIRYGDDTDRKESARGPRPHRDE